MRFLLFLSSLCFFTCMLSAQTPAWHEAVPSAPWPERCRQTVTFFHGQFWLLGGATQGLLYNDIWSSGDGRHWVRQSLSAPWSARYGHTTLVFNNRLWLLGGDAMSGLQHDVWSSPDGVNWTRETLAAPWVERYGHTSVVFNNRMWVLGGFGVSSGVGFSALNDVWSSADGVNWTRATASAAWPVRSQHASVVFNNRMWVFGGQYGPFYNDAWSSTDGVNWTQEVANAPWQARRGHSVVAYNNQLWVLGGENNHQWLNDVWCSADGVNWALKNSAAPWQRRSEHSALAANGQLWVMGGWNGTGRLHDVWSFADIDAGVLNANAQADAEWSPPGSELVVMDLSASAYNADQQLQSVTFTQTGSVADADFVDVRLFRDANDNGVLNASDIPLGSGALTGGRVTFSGAPLLDVAASSGTRLLLVVDTVVGIALNSDIRFEISSAADIVWSAGTDLAAYPVQGEDWKYHGVRARTLGATSVGSAYSDPFNYSSGSGRFQTAYSATELNVPAGTEIRGIRVLGTQASPVPEYGNLRVRIAHTSLAPDALTDVFDANYQGALTTCLGPADVTPTLQTVAGLTWYVFALTTPFVYDGTDGIVVDWSYDTRSDYGFLVSKEAGRKRVTLNNGHAGSTSGNLDDYGNFGVQFDVLAPPSAPGLAVQRPSGSTVVNGGTHTVFGTQSGAPVVLDYDMVNLGSSGVTLLGNPPVAVTAGTGTPAVSVTSQPPSSLAPGASGSFAIQVTPSAPGNWDLQVAIPNSGPDTPYVFTIHGYAQVPELTVSRGSIAIAAAGVDPQPKTPVGQSTTLAYVAANAGGAELDFAGAAPVMVTSGSGAPAVSVTLQPAGPLPALQSSMFKLSVTPTTSGPWDAEVSIASNDPNSPYTFTLSGDGYVPLPLMGVLGSGPNLFDNGGTHLLTGTGSDPYTVNYTITNRGTGPLQLTGAPGNEVVISGEINCSVQLTQAPAADTAPGAYNPFAMLVTPASDGDVRFDVSIASNDATNDPYTWTFHGVPTVPVKQSKAGGGGAGCAARARGLACWLLCLLLASGFALRRRRVRA